jgi:RimJ/RimL family protein N-acetyltransferase/GNAT superfamily N-acetyltransferase
MTELIELETERLHLRQWIESDREPFARLNADSRVMEFFPSILDRAASDAMIDRVQTKIAEKGWGLWAVESKQDKQLIGYVGLQILTANLPFSPGVEIGWRLAFEYWGKGYATEAAQAALKVGFDRLELSEIVSFTAIHNHRSSAVMERLGMIRDAETFEHPSLPAGYSLCEHCLYRLSKEKWQSDVFRKNPTAFTIRQSNADDAPLFYRVIEQTMREFIIATWGRWNESRVLEESLEDSISPNAQVIQIGDVAVGVFLVERSLTHIQLEQIYLLPEYQRLGIGSALINSLIKEASKSQLPIHLRVMTINPAKKFYEKLDFKVIEVTSEFLFMEKVP